MTTDRDESMEPSEEELAEAEALARALERGTGTEALPDDALSTAALLRYSQDGGELADERKSAILDEVLATAKPKPAPATVEKPLLGWLKWLVPIGGLGAVAAVALALLVAMPSASPDTAPSASEVATVAPTDLPAPGVALLRAQAEAASAAEGADVVLASEMRTYRGALFAALEERYGR
jgi:hypothetical protein